MSSFTGAGAYTRQHPPPPSVYVGRTIHLNYRPFTVVGVASPDFLGTIADFRPAVWIPFAPFRDRYTRWAARVHVYARLRPDADVDQARQELSLVAARLDQAHPRTDAERRLRLEKATWIDPRDRLEEWSIVQVMTVAAGTLLLLVCANVANVLLAVALQRRRENALRAALGASPGHLVGRVLLENVLLAVFAGAVALLLARPLSQRLGDYFARPGLWGMYVGRDAVVDLRVVTFTFLAAVVTGVLAALLPALRTQRRDLLDALKSDADNVSPKRLWGRRLPELRELLVSTQVALAVVLLVVAGLVLRTLATAGSLDPGFDYDNLVVTHISTSSTDLKPEERDRFFRDLAARLPDEPWVRTATVQDQPLLANHPRADLVPEGRDEAVELTFSNVIPGFFEALDIDVREGRGFAQTDDGEAPDVAIVNETLAHRFFPGKTAVGRRLRRPGMDGAPDRVFTIVGVVADTRTSDLLAEPPPTVYFSYPQHPYPTGSALIISTLGDPSASVTRLHRYLRDAEPHLAIVNVVTYRDVVRGILYTHRMNAEMFSVVALLALLLSAVGIWNVMSLAVRRRTREIAIRMAVGARRGDIGNLVLSRAFASVALGLGVGLAAAAALTDLVRGLLFGVEPTDPFALAAGTTVLLLAALAAAWLPAHRAATVDPTVSLRHE